MELSLAKYKKREDDISQFLEEEIELLSEGKERIIISDLYKGYRTWCESTGIQPLIRKHFKEALELRGTYFFEYGRNVCIYGKFKNKD